MKVEEAKEKECCQLEGRCQADKGGLVMEELIKVVEALCLMSTNCIDVDNIPFRCDRRCPQKKDYYKQLYPECPLDTIYYFLREMKRKGGEL